MALDIKYWKSRKKAGKAAWCVKFQTSQKFFQTKEEAQHFAKNIKREATGDLSNSWDWNVDKLCREYLAWIEGEMTKGYLNKSNWVAKVRHIKYFTSCRLNGDWVGNAKVLDLAEGHFTLQFIDQLCVGRKVNTVKNIMLDIKCLFDFAIASGCRNTNPAKGIKSKSGKPDQETYEDLAEKIQPNIIEKILNAADEIEAQRCLMGKAAADNYWRTAMHFAIATGLRQGEQRALTWGDIWWDQNKIDVNKAIKHEGKLGKTKTKKGMRQVILSPELKSELQELYLARGRPNDFTTLVFPGRFGAVRSTSTFSKQMHKVCKFAEVEYIRWHDLRHFYASNLLQLYPGDLWRVCNYMGHESIETTNKIYGHWINESNEAQQEHVDKVSGAFGRFAKSR